MTAVAALTALAAAMAGSPEGLSHIPLSEGLTLVSALHSPQGERENVVRIESSTDSGVSYSWHVVRHAASGESDDASFSRFVRAADLTSAQRLNSVFWPNDATQYPGYTAFSISSAVYDRLRSSSEAPFSVTALDERGPFGALAGGSAQGSNPFAGALRNHLVYKGTLATLAPQPESFPLIVNGQRVSAPALHLRGRFTYQQKPLQQEIWVLADRAHPLILKAVTGTDTYQMIRIEMPATREVPGALDVVEKTLDSACRAELPGVYFAFGSAVLDKNSGEALAGVGAMLAHHADWTLAVEGHTDNIGTAAANETLSLARAEAVRASLVQQYRVDTRRLTAQGYGAQRPRESNSTIEGRARNRRVELVRPCASPSGGKS